MVRTVATVRMPMPFSVEMSSFSREIPPDIMKGFWSFESKSGASAHAIHYTADPAKDPATVEGAKWYAEAIKGYVGGVDSYLWRQHMEIDFEAVKGTKLIPFWDSHKKYFVIDDIEESAQSGWRYYAGFDYGKRNKTVLGVYAVDRAGNRYTCGEIAGSGESLGGVPGIARRIKAHPLYEKFRRNIKADPSLWNKNQAKASGGYTSIAKLFSAEGVSLKSAPVKGSEADRIAIERLLFHYWAIPDEPELFIFRSCKTHCKQFKGLRYREYSDAVAVNKAMVEELVDRENDSWDAWKYAETCRPNPSVLKKKPTPGSFEDIRKKHIASLKTITGIRGSRKSTKEGPPVIMGIG